MRPHVDARRDVLARDRVVRVAHDAPRRIRLGRRDGGDEVVAEVAEASHVADRAAFLRVLVGHGAVAEDDHRLRLREVDDSRAVVALLAERVGELVAIRGGRAGDFTALARVDFLHEVEGVLFLGEVTGDDVAAIRRVRTRREALALGVLGGENGAAHRGVPLLGRFAVRVEIEVRAAFGVVPNDRLLIAVLEGERALLVERVAVRHALDVRLAVLADHAVDGAIVVDLAGHRAGHRFRVGVVVVALPDVVAGDVTLVLRVHEAVVASVALAIGRERAVGLELVAVPVEGLVVGLHDLLEGVADGELVRVAVAAGRRAAGDQVREHAARELEAVTEVDHLRVREQLVRDVEVALVEIELGRVHIIRIADVELHRRVVDGVVDAEQRQRVEVVGSRDEVLREVDADVVAIDPGAVLVVLFDDVRLFTGLRVVRATDVELLLDRELVNDEAVVLREGLARIRRVGNRMREALLVGARDALEADATDELALLDLPLDLGDRVDAVREQQGIAAGLAIRNLDEHRTCVELRIVLGVRVVAANEEALGNRVQLNAVDRVTLCRATDHSTGAACAPHNEGCQADPAQPLRLHPDLLNAFLASQLVWRRAPTCNC